MSPQADLKSGLGLVLRLSKPDAHAGPSPATSAIQARVQVHGIEPDRLTAGLRPLWTAHVAIQLPEWPNACLGPVSVYTESVRFFASQPKRAANIAKHGYDPAEFEMAFSFDRYLSRRARPSPTGRERLLLVGTWFGRAVVTIIISPLGTEACDVVSVRDASDKERAAYDDL